MAEVFVPSWGEYEDRWPIGVYTSRELAFEAWKKVRDEWAANVNRRALPPEVPSDDDFECYLQTWVLDAEPIA